MWDARSLSLVNGYMEEAVKEAKKAETLGEVSTECPLQPPLQWVALVGILAHSMAGDTVQLCHLLRRVVCVLYLCTVSVSAQLTSLQVLMSNMLQTFSGRLSTPARVTEIGCMIL